MLNLRSRGFDNAQYDIWWNMLIKFSKQTGNIFTKIINTKVNSKPCQTGEMELFPEVVTNFRGELRILPTSKLELFAKRVKNGKPFTIFSKALILDVWQVSEYVSELASKVRDVSFLNQFKYQR